jgi:hypothetical protein
MITEKLATVNVAIGHMLKVSRMDVPQFLERTGHSSYRFAVVPVRQSASKYFIVVKGIFSL